MMADRRDKEDDLSFDNGHFSHHFLEGREGTHAISQDCQFSGSEFVSYTEVDSDGNVGESGFDYRV